jgi:hypothetical protein
MPKARLIRGKTSNEEWSLICNLLMWCVPEQTQLKKKKEEIMYHLIWADEYCWGRYMCNFEIKLLPVCKSQDLGVVSTCIPIYIQWIGGWEKLFFLYRTEPYVIQFTSFSGWELRSFGLLRSQFGKSLKTFRDNLRGLISVLIYFAAEAWNHAAFLVSNFGCMYAKLAFLNETSPLHR